MKKALLFISVLWAFFCLFGCDRDVDRLSTGIDSIDRREALLSLEIESLGTHLRGDQETDPMKVVGPLMVAFFDGEGALVIRKDIVPERDKVTGSYRWEVKLPKGSYQMIVGANLPPVLDRYFTIGRDLSEITSLVEKERILSMLNASYSKAKGEHLCSAIPMFNDQGVVHISREMFGTDAATPTAVKVRLEPILGRILVLGKPQVNNGFCPDGGAIKFFISNGERGTYLLRHMDKLSGGVQEEVAGDGSEVQHRYAKSPSFDLSFLKGEKDYLYVNQAVFEKNAVAAAEKYEDVNLQNALLYSREMTLPPSDYYVGGVPHITIALTYIPSGIAGVEENSEDKTWVSFRGFQMSFATFRAYVDKAGKKETVDVPGLSDAILSSNRDSLLKGIGFEGNDIRIYAKGVNYYVVPIRHFDDEKAGGMDSYGRYGIVRNNEYRIHLRTVNNAGSPIVPDLSHFKEEMTKPVFLGGGIEVANLCVRDVDVDL